jgi:hypothetical protein
MYQANHQIRVSTTNCISCILQAILRRWEFTCQVQKVSCVFYIDTTAELGIPTTIANRSQEITFNFKNVGTSPIFPPNSTLSNIQVTVYLTGIEAQS